MTCSMTKMTAMTLLSSLLIASNFVGVAAQNASSLAPILQALQAENLTSLANAAQQVANTTAGQQIVTLLSSGAPITVFAPDNNAFTGVPENITSNPDLLAEVLSYHVIPGTFNFSSFSEYGHTVLRTALNASDQVYLEPGAHQVLVGQKSGENVKILNQDTDVESYNSTTISGTNITLNKVNAVIDLPTDFAAVFQQNGLNAFTAAARQAGLLETLNFTHAITIFAPSDAAFARAARQLGPEVLNASNTDLQNVLLNHVVNGSVIYSSEFEAGDLISAGGEPITVTPTNSSGNATGLMMLHGRRNATVPYSISSTNGNITTNASFIQTDLLSWSGVLHIIDSVLLNNMSDPAVASSAFESATASAASEASVQATATTPVGGLVGTEPAGASGPQVTQTQPPARHGGAGSGKVNYRGALVMSGLMILLGGLIVLF